MKGPLLLMAGIADRGEPVFEHKVKDRDDFLDMLSRHPRVFIARAARGGKNVEPLRQLLIRGLLLASREAGKVMRFSSAVSQRRDHGEAFYETICTSADCQKAPHLCVWVRDSVEGMFLASDMDKPLAELAAVTINRIAHRAKLLRNEKWLTAEQVHTLLNPGRRYSNVSQTATKLRLEKKLMGAYDSGRYVYPLVQFDLSAQEVLPVIAQLLSVLPSTLDEWDRLHWLFTARRSLSGNAPAALLSTRPQEVLAAATGAFNGAEKSSSARSYHFQTLYRPATREG